jgi:nucleotide-binding universal stress UspA family protein
VAPPEASAGPGETEAPEPGDAIGFRRIVVPLDGSPLAEQALPYSETLAGLTGAPLHLVRVLDPTYLGTFDGSMAMQHWIEDARGVARHYLARMEQDLRQRQWKVTAEYRLGPAASELLAAAQPGDLLVMATHGRSGLGRWFLGSVAEAVLRRASVPVLLVRAGETAPASPIFRRLVVPLDGSPLAEKALPAALALATRLQVPTHLVTVVEGSGMEPPELAAAAVSSSRFAGAVTQLQAEAQTRLAGPAARLEHAGVTTTTEVRHGVPGFTIAELTQPGDLIVMTSHGRTGLGRWFLGSVAETVVRQATVPVLLVRAAPAPPDRPTSGSTA